MPLPQDDQAEANMVASAPEVSFHDLLVAALPALRQQALALTRNRADADDLVQTSVSSALAAQTSFQPGTNFGAWMARILRNRFLSNMRRRREIVDIEDAPASLLARSGGQEEGLAIQQLRHLIGKLPADHRLVLIMISVQGLSYEEASEQLDVPVGTLKCRVSRARAMLRRWLLGDDEAPKPRVAAPKTRTRASVPSHALSALPAAPVMAKLGRDKAGAQLERR
ncbi:sigma-70 family RNA polymerase sigma factor [Roseococcus microcysteis]|uniref:sigma-70 family RNA polymerase sigma factor n=1 Tax=Roseococcus microcysteis TaxID=2771361 RepID=UPI00168AFFA5|nr:sigma-70 family RNA polymerase sigma factor [Roseococcus microcysteis]